MDGLLAMASGSGIGKAAREAGLSLTQDQVREIAEAERACLAACGRVSFGEPAAAKLIRAFSNSPYLAGSDVVETLSGLTEAFYDLREDLPAQMSDAEIIEALQERFDGLAAGDVGLASALAREDLVSREAVDSYEIADDDGKVYRWDPEEWRDDVQADGWHGERWDADYE